MEKDRKCFTITWRIENYNFCFKRRGNGFSSPSFVINSIKDTLWKLIIIPNPREREECLFLCIQRIGSISPESGVLFEPSFSTDDSLFLSRDGSTNTKSYKEYFSDCFVPYHEVYTRKRGFFYLPRTLTIRCKMYMAEGSFSDAGQCFARTRIRVEKTAFVGFMEKFSSLVPDEKRILSIKSSSTKEQLFTLSLSLDGNLCCKERIWIEIVPNKTDDIKFCKSKIFLVDCEGNKTKYGRNEYLYENYIGERDPEKWKFPLNFTKGYLKKNAQFLPNDILTLKYEFAFSGSTEYKQIEDSEFGSLVRIDKKRSNFPSALQDITCLFKEGILCDVKLRTETETFDVHKSILSARSSVFKSMFTTDMKEKTTDCVIIEDLDADTVGHMIKFLYSDDLEIMEWERAKSLYFAADKYNIVALKHRCSEFLQSKLQPPECCDLLLLSDKHHDEELKKAVQKYIAVHHEEVLQTDQWLNLEKKFPVLATETFRALYLKN